MEKHRFNLYLRGLLKVLAEHLYSTKKVGVRELIQNAHDSCVRRRIEEGGEGYQPRIELAINAARRTLTIRDNGCRLTEEEIGDYLLAYCHAAKLEKTYRLDRIREVRPAEAANVVT